MDQDQYRVSPRAVVNTRVGYGTDRWGLYLYTRNLLNEKYQQYVYAAIHQAVLGEPRTIGGELDLHW